jgi:hypothetical protein
MEKMKFREPNRGTFFSLSPAFISSSIPFLLNFIYSTFYSFLSVPSAINPADINAVNLFNASKNFQMPKRQL